MKMETTNCVCPAGVWRVAVLCRSDQESQAGTSVHQNNYRL